MARERHFEAGFAVWIIYPMPVSIGGQLVYIETEIELYCEPDESVGDTDWWISSMEIAASREPSLRPVMIEIPRVNPMFGRIAKWAAATAADHINIAFGEWQMDREPSFVAS